MNNLNPSPSQMVEKSHEERSIYYKEVIFLLLLYMASVAHVRGSLIECMDTIGHPTDSLKAFISACPNSVAINILHEGTVLNLATDDKNMLVCLSVAHPAIQMRLLMQPTSIIIDPTGRKRKHYEIRLPSALDVRDELETLCPDDNAEHGSDVRPDISPLITELNRKGAIFRKGRSECRLGFQRFHIELDREKAAINFYVLLPKDELMQTRKLRTSWTIGLVSDNDRTNMPPLEGSDGGDMMQFERERHPSEETDIIKLMQSNIRCWEKFSIDDVNNANVDREDESSTLEQALDEAKLETKYGNDTLTLSLATYDLPLQMTLLMQGLRITMDSTSIEFPAAYWVRDKIQRHPNEVKPSFNGTENRGTMVRPDIVPLLSALNDTTASIVRPNGDTELSHDYKIDVDRETGLMTFRIRYRHTFAQKRLLVTIYSSPEGLPMGNEFIGQQRSEEARKHPLGLGEGLQQADIGRRTIRKHFNLHL
ncbi:MAG: hypothetical protein J5486_11000 [Bacteroidaceae bacterium]|nr:hypothetical protein [Bacteroidaceae bacterium]